MALSRANPTAFPAASVPEKVRLSFTPSPLVVLRGMAQALWRDLARLLLSTAVFFLVPYLAGYFLIYKPVVDGSGAYGDTTGYYVRYYGFIAWYFVVRGLNLCTTGQLLYNGFAGRPMSLAGLLPHGLSGTLRALPVYLPVAVAIYIGFFLWVVPGLVIGFFALFYLIAFVLERRGPIRSWREGARVRHGHNLMLAVNYGLLTGALNGAQKGLTWLTGFSSGHLSFTVQSVLIATIYAVLELVSHAGMLSLYFSTRTDDAPRTLADVFE